MHWLVREIVGRTVRRIARHKFTRFESATRHCRATQHRLLLARLRRHAASDFGRVHGFDRIRSPADLRRHVPITSYEYYAPYIERLKRGEVSALFGPHSRVLMFALTSGTTSEPKFIPVTEQSIDDYRTGWMFWGIRTFDEHPELYRLKVLQMASDWELLRTPSGAPCGSVSGMTATMQKRIVRERYCVPACLAKIRDIEAKYYTVLRCSIAHPVGMAMAANPSTLVALAKLGDRTKDSLLRDLADGTLAPDLDVPSPVRAALLPFTRLRHRARARELERIIAATGHLYPKDYWPTLRLVANWTGGSMGAYLRQYPETWGNIPVRDIGLIASEGRMTIPIADRTSAGVLDILHQFFEFVPESELDCANPVVLEAHELREGENYFILLTTSGGLWRYNIHDLVRCVGFYHETPVLEFLNKGSHFSSLTGEKLSEFQVSRAVEESLEQCRLALSAFTVAPCWGDPPYYAVLVEKDEVPSVEQAAALVESIDQHLRSQNLEYDSKRSSHRLGSMRMKVLPPRTWEQYTRVRLMASGGTPEQYKHRCLVPDLDFVRGFRVLQEILPGPPSPERKLA